MMHSAHLCTCYLFFHQTQPLWDLRKFPVEGLYVEVNGRSPLLYVVSMRKSCLGTKTKTRRL